MTKIVFTTLFAVLFVTVAFAQLTHISVRKNHFVTSEGQVIVFKGLDSSEPDKLEKNGQWNKHYFEMVKAWGANIVRIPIHPAAWRVQGKENYLKLLDQGVAWAQELGLYVIIDWHSIGNLIEEKFFECPSEQYLKMLYHTSREETFDFWRTIANRYGKNNTVAFFELFNEPTINPGKTLDNAAWTEWKALMEDLIKTIRTNGCTTIPLIAGFNFGYDLSQVATAPINAENIGYVSHPYPGKAVTPLEQNWTQDWGFVANTYPLFLTEIGFVEAETPDADTPIVGDESYGEAITSYCNQHGISYTIWCFDPHWSPSLIKDWDFTPTKAGIYFKKILLQRQ